jgi:hypothetical protein
VPSARVVYRDVNFHVRELSLGRNTYWTSADLSQITGAPRGVSGPYGFVTDFPGEGQSARVVYYDFNGRIQEISYGATTRRWSVADLTTRVGAPLAAPTGSLHGYATALHNQGNVGRVVYRTHSGAVQELAVRPDGWSSTNLSGATGAPPAGNYIPTGFVTNLTGQGAVARVLYPNAAGEVIEISGGR